MPGRKKAHPGVFERAAGGTLFLDEITAMSPDLQARLLRVLETGEFMRLGGSEALTCSARIVAATNRDPAEAIPAGALRRDLMFRLAVFPINLPPLRAREGDVLMLARHFLAEMNRQYGTSKKFTAEAEARLASYDWPGNVRELKKLRATRLYPGRPRAGCRCGGAPEQLERAGGSIARNADLARGAIAGRNGTRCNSGHAATF